MPKKTISELRRELKVEKKKEKKEKEYKKVKGELFRTKYRKPIAFSEKVIGGASALGDSTKGAGSRLADIGHGFSNTILGGDDLDIGRPPKKKKKKGMSYGYGGIPDNLGF